jgi:hypothetical protein
MKNQEMPLSEQEQIIVARWAKVEAMRNGQAGSQAVDSQAEKRVIGACREALKAEADYAFKAVTAGLLLMEFRHVLSPLPHCGATGRFQAKTEENGWRKWLAAHSIAKTTADRWMLAAERVARLQLGVRMDMELPGAIDVEGVLIPLSQALTAPEAELPERALQFRQGVFDFMRDKTLSEAMVAAIDGESPAHRITRAGAGKMKGGAGGDRKDWPAFIAEKLSDVTGHLKHWRGMSSTQKESVEETLRRVMERWPTPVLEHVRKVAVYQLTRR